jgi:hypothetical protein
MNFKALLAVAAVAAAATSPAAAVNLITNGSFENGLAGWTLVNSNTSAFPPVVISYGPGQAYPNGAFGEAVPAANAATLSPDAAGARGAYFVEDLANNQGLQQLTPLLAGNYRVGFSAFLPFNGLNNVNNASFTAMIQGISVTSFTIDGTSVGGTWVNFSRVGQILIPGFY